MHTLHVITGSMTVHLGVTIEIMSFIQLQLAASLCQIFPHMWELLIFSYVKVWFRQCLSLFTSLWTVQVIFNVMGKILASGWYLVHYFSVASTDELWIGLNDIRIEGLFDWSDQSHVSFTSWEYGKPGVSTDGDDCVLIRGEVRPCAYLFIYMC